MRGGDGGAINDVVRDGGVVLGDEAVPGDAATKGANDELEGGLGGLGEEMRRGGDENENEMR